MFPLVLTTSSSMDVRGRGAGVMQKAADDRAALVAHPQVIARYQRIVDEVNATLAPFETIKRIAVVADEWTIETDELTPSMKLKRRVVEKKYAAAIAAFYVEDAKAAV